MAAAEAKEETLQLTACGIGYDLAGGVAQDLGLAERLPNLLGRGNAPEIREGAIGHGHRDAVAAPRGRLSQ